MASRMGLSQPLIGRGTLWAALAAVSMTVVSVPAVAQAVFTPPPPPFGAYKGRLELQLSAGTGTVSYFTPAGVENAALRQTIETRRRNDCRLPDYTNAQLAGQLLNFSATRSGSTAEVGLVSGSMGVFSGSQGTPCGRFFAGGSEALTVAIGEASPAEVFYRLELDIEAKSNLALQLDILRDGVVVDTYELRTGSSRVAGEGDDLKSLSEVGTFGSDDLLPVELTSQRIFNCPAPKSADSGPDAGALDNCRWTVNELGHGFRLRPRVGEGSLEGASDTPYVTRIYLTDSKVGVFDCTPGTSSTRTLFGTDPDNPGSCTVTRVSPDAGAQCTTAGYVLRNLGGDEGRGCELIKASGEQLVAWLDITFPVEKRTNIADPSLTAIFFAGSDEPFTPERCQGTLVPPGIDPVTGQVTGYTIAEVLDRPHWVTDHVATTTNLEWACILEDVSLYLGEKPIGDNGENEEAMQVTQTILF